MALGGIYRSTEISDFSLKWPVCKTMRVFSWSQGWKISRYFRKYRQYFPGTPWIACGHDDIDDRAETQLVH